MCVLKKVVELILAKIIRIILAIPDIGVVVEE